MKVLSRRDSQGRRRLVPITAAHNSLHSRQRRYTPTVAELTDRVTRLRFQIRIVSQQPGTTKTARQEEASFLETLAAIPVHIAPFTWRAALHAAAEVGNETQDAIVARVVQAGVSVAARLSPGEQAAILSARTDTEVLMNMLQIPAIQEEISAADPLAPATLRWMTEQQRLLSAEGGVITVNQLANVLKVTTQAIRQRYARGRLLAFPIGSVLYVPIWQFSDTRDYHVLPGLHQVLHELSGEDDWGKAIFLLGGEPYLNGERPLDYLRRGEVEPVLIAAQHYHEQGAL